MAQHVQVVLVDDLVGGEAAETVSFALDGVNYEIDLNEENAAKLRDELATWVGHARRVGARAAAGGGRRQAGRARASGGGTTDTAAIREWARAHGHKVSERGRISSEVMAAYKAANA